MSVVTAWRLHMHGAGVGGRETVQGWRLPDWCTVLRDRRPSGNRRPADTERHLQSARQCILLSPGICQSAGVPQARFESSQVSSDWELRSSVFLTLCVLCVQCGLVMCSPRCQLQGANCRLVANNEVRSRTGRGHVVHLSFPAGIDGSFT